MIENTCKRIDAHLTQDKTVADTELASVNWQSLTDLHHTLLQHHHDFFLTTQLSSASPDIRGLAKTHSMPARMWKHGIHSFLELFRKHLPDSIKYMRQFLDLANQVLKELYRKIPAFEDT
jgi:hypothetical protein